MESLERSDRLRRVFIDTDLPPEPSERLMCTVPMLIETLPRIIMTAGAAIGIESRRRFSHGYSVCVNGSARMSRQGYVRQRGATYDEVVMMHPHLQAIYDDILERDLDDIAKLALCGRMLAVAVSHLQYIGDGNTRVARLLEDAVSGGYSAIQHERVEDPLRTYLVEDSIEELVRNQQVARGLDAVVPLPGAVFVPSDLAESLTRTSHVRDRLLNEFPYGIKDDALELVLRQAFYGHAALQLACENSDEIDAASLVRQRDEVMRADSRLYVGRVAAMATASTLSPESAFASIDETADGGRAISLVPWRAYKKSDLSF